MPFPILPILLGIAAIAVVSGMAKGASRVNGTVTDGYWLGTQENGSIHTPGFLEAVMYRGLAWENTGIDVQGDLYWSVYALPPVGETWKMDVFPRYRMAQGSYYGKVTDSGFESQTRSEAEAWIDEYIAGGGIVPAPGASPW